ncbi:50S ribosomal protein L18e [Candidatus Bathyarchaeota archaeon]|nr:50S ribosomal protein L18e [Candidatus Bathyarchaeota archaeon]
MAKPKTVNPELIRLIRFLRKKSRENKVKIWKDVAVRLAKARRKRIAVNVSRLNRYTEKKETIVVPGKVVGAGKLDHSVTVAAFAFSEKAKEKIKAARGKPISMLQLVKKNPKGSNVKMIG